MIDYYTKKLEKNQEYYKYVRKDVLDFISENNIISGGEKVLEIGCGNGATGKKIMQDYGISDYYGIELMKEPAEIANTELTEVIHGDFEKMIQSGEFHNLDAKKYDVLIVLDVLEHMVDPWLVLKTTSNWLTNGGIVIASIPNAGNWYVIKKLLLDRFEYEERGLLDKTHLRFFTYHTINNLFQSTGFEIRKSSDTNDLFLRKLNVFNKITFGVFRKNFIKQYLIMAKKK